MVGGKMDFKGFGLFVSVFDNVIVEWIFKVFGEGG